MVGTNHTTTYSYTDSYSTCSGAAPPDGNTNAYLTDITDPLGHTRSFCYGYTDGQVRSGTDPNGQTTTYAYSDSLDRLTRITYPTGGGVTSYSYNDAPPTPSVSMTHNLGFGIGSNTTISVMDGAGHVTQTQLTGDPAGTDYVTTTFNGEGHTNTVTNPYRSGGTQYLTDLHLRRSGPHDRGKASRRQVRYDGLLRPRHSSNRRGQWHPKRSAHIANRWLGRLPLCARSAAQRSLALVARRLLVVRTSLPRAS